MRNIESGLARFAFFVLILLLGSNFGCTQRSQAHDDLLQSTSGYQEVMLTSGAVYFGKLEGLGTPFPVLRDVYYLQSSEDPQTHAQKISLIRRGREAHAPDRMILNAQHILLIEPVGKDSRIADLISESKARSASQ